MFQTCETKQKHYWYQRNEGWLNHADDRRNHEDDWTLPIGCRIFFDP